MKSKISFFLMLGLLAIGFQGCLKDTCKTTRRYIQFTPIYKTLDEIRKEIKIEGPRTLENPGKLYFYGDYILINEIKEGIHIIDNSDPKQPKNLSFIGIPGNVDLAAKNGRLYVDNYIDLLTLDISNPTAPKLVTRTEEVFEGIDLHQDLGYLVEWQQEEKSMEIDCNHPNWNRGFFFDDGLLWAEADLAVSGVRFASTSNGGSVDFNTPVGAGTGGSLARFTIVDQLLYTVDQFNLRIFDIADCDNPSFENLVNIGWGVETIFPYEESLFIGAEHGMYIFDNAV
ncbi:MAG: hypothetical protein AAFO94_20770 [Bacteroidota bacterium]